MHFRFSKSLKKWFAAFLTVVMLAGGTTMTALAANQGGDSEVNPADYIVLDQEKSSFVDDYNCKCELYFTIKAGAPADLTVDIAKYVRDLAYAGDNRFTIMPGATISVNVHVTNESAMPYRYKDGSLVVSSGDFEGMIRSEFVGKDGNKIPMSHVGAVSPSIRPIAELFGVSGPSVTAKMLIGIYDYLEAKGFTGDEALSNYLLDYYNTKDGTSFATFDEMVRAKGPSLADRFAQGGSAATKDITFGEMKAALAQHPEVDPYIMVFFNGKGTPADSDTVGIQLKWPEQPVAAFSYDIFYEDMFATAFGAEEVAKMSPISNTSFTRTRGLFDYLNHEGEAFKTANAYLASVNDGMLKSGETMEFPMVYTMDGPGVGNGYANYEISVNTTFDLEQIPTSYTVSHNYFVSVDGAEPEACGVVTKNYDGFVGQTVKGADIEALPAYDEKEFTLTSVSDDIVLSADVKENHIDLVYLLEVHNPAKYVVEHNYYTSVDGGEYKLDGTVEKVYDTDLFVNDLIKAEDVEKILTYKDNEYTFFKSSGDIVLKIEGENKIVVEYRRDVESPKVPETGDNSNNLLMAAGLTAAAALGAIVLLKKKRAQ